MVIAISNEKGGVAKTTTTANLGYLLSLKGYRVLLIDLDSQSNLSSLLGVTDPKISSAELLSKEEPAKKAVNPVQENLDLIPGSVRLSFVEQRLTEPGREFKLREALDPIRQDYDWILIDTGPSLGTLTINALTACDRVLIPIQADYLSYVALESIATTIETVKRYTNTDLCVDGVLITRFNQRTNLAKEMEQAVGRLALETLNTKIYATPIREATAVKEAQLLGVALFEHAPKSAVVQDYNRFVEEFLERKDV